uniref:Family with sequence similarity 83 member G n=1 Tax=Cyprinus carpio TaxID=7962 RepID=A0A8C2A0E5_CYPCA
MALSQVQCLDDNHIHLRTNESKPEFFYSEQQRLALETLIHDGQDAYEDYIQTNNIRSFLSDLELESILNTLEVYCPGSPDFDAELLGESDGEDVSLQYWPDRSDLSIPLLDIGWPDRASYRGITRVQVVRKMISQAQTVIAIVMDLFTDIDIFKDLLDASYKRKVSVYIMLETTGVKHFLRMCEKAETDFLRSIRGAEFFSRSSKRVCGSQSQKFMFIDGYKAVSGSYSFTWSASRLDRNLITVLTGQAVDTFDSLFQDMYVMSNGVCLSKINLSSEPEPDFLPQAVPTLLPSATTALKLINPKYTLVSNCAFTTNGPVSDQTGAKNNTSMNQTEVIKQIKDTPVVPPVHPGLLNLEKANMINYLPTWPNPDPPSDVIGFINIRDSSKPLQAHLMRSELFEVSQAIRFKDPLHEPKESLSLRDSQESTDLDNKQTLFIPKLLKTSCS